MNPLPSEPLTDEDRAVWFDWQVSRPRAWLRDWLLWGALENLSFAADRRDANAMLVMVEAGYSKVVQAPSGDWAWYRHPRPRVPL